jgi:hypothetical protein
MKPDTELTLQNYDVIAVFEDGGEEVIKVQGKGPLGAIYTAAMSRRTEWSPEKQIQVVALRIPNGT